MRILFATSEFAPLVKTGGLADVSAALPAALRRLGADVRVLMPAYASVLNTLSGLREVAAFTLSGFPPARLLMHEEIAGVPVLFLDCPELYQRNGGPYQNENGSDWQDNARRFGLLSKVIAVLGSDGSPLDWHPQVVSCNDWQTGLAPAYLHYSDRPVPSVMAIHNLAFQGLFAPHVTAELGLPADSFQMDGVEFYGQLSFLKAGLYYADRIVTVSPSYAGEIQTDALGFGMQGLLRHRSNVLSGILNGVDYLDWDSATDDALIQNYDSTNLVAGKRANKLELQRRMGLDVDATVPLLGLVSRFTHQKGVDLVLEVAPQLLDMGAQLVLLGSGDASLQQAAVKLAQEKPGRMAVRIGFDESLSRLIEAGADIFLMPSRFEPCGLNQMYSQRYGTPPIVHATGGLKDTVTDCTAQTMSDGTATGFVFSTADAHHLMLAVRRALNAYQDKTAWARVQQNGMRRDFSWDKSAAQYFAIYSELLEQQQ